MSFRASSTCRKTLWARALVNIAFLTNIRTINYHTTCNLYHFIQIQEIMILVSNIKYITLLVNMFLLKTVFDLIYPELKIIVLILYYTK